MTIDVDSFDMAPPNGAPFQTTNLISTKEVLELFDTNVSKVRKSLANVNNEELMKNWSLLSGGNIIFSLPKIVVLRSFVINHIIHHRAQLGVCGLTICLYRQLTDHPRMKVCK